MTEGFERKRLRVNNAPDVHFEGALLHEYSTDPKGEKARWTELRLWQTPAGAWIAESVGCSKREGETDIRDVLVIERYEGEPAIVALGTIRAVRKSDQDAIREVMDFFGWTIVAKAFAKNAGWDVIRHVD